MRPRPCTCDRQTTGEPYVKGRDCLLCWQYHNDPRYKRLWSLPAIEPQGVGTELKAILAWFGQEARASCKCQARAAVMDREGVEWCEANQAIIVGWLMEAWASEGLTLAEFVPRGLRRFAAALASKIDERKIAERGARWAVRAAIKRARRRI